MAKSDKIAEIKALKKALSQEKRKNKTLEKKYSEEKLKNKLQKCESKKKARELILSSLSEKEREVVELLFPDTDTEK
jgi:DNA repair protein RadC